MVQAERRSKQRFTQSLAVSLGSESDSGPLGTTRDISAAGAYLRIPPDKLVAGDAIDFRMELPSDLELTAGVKVVCRGQVLRVGRASDQHSGVAVRIESYDFVRRS